ncbi:uncharacterized protein LOC124277563 [Haliotis rubra]|uniref:uncharacterized protein LOC124277563 n=1 Tax=Haliotis rubra TaxID=36100 RepID=UPI001EE62574|nr:uncharacterized protein LOC124277563 [Haliotis rubra]
MSLTSSSDSDPELDYSDEEIRCSFTRSPTISDEDGEDTHILATSNFGLSYDERKELLNTNFTQQKRDLRLYPGNMHNWLKDNHPDIFQRLQHFLKDKNHFAFCAPSVSQSLNSRRAPILPKNMICDVCIFTEHQPTFVLTFRTREDIQDKVGGLNAELNRYIVAEIRRGTSTNFSSVYGVVNKHDCLSDQLFNAKIEAFINFVNTIAAPHSLRMNYATYRSSAHCFMKMVPEQTSDLTADYIEHGKELFIERNGFTQCKDRLKTHKSVVIVSPPGEGKTTLGLALLRYFREQEHGAKYQPIILQTPEEWQKQIDKTSHQIILIDDMFGMYVLSQSKLCHWRDKMPDMIHSLVGGSKLLVMTLRNNIFRDLSATCTLKLFQPDNVIDLWFTRPLLYQDKDLLAKIYSQHHGANVSGDYIKAVATAESVQGFPLLCKTLMQSVAKGTSRDDMDCVHIQILSTEIQNLKDYDVSIFALLVIVALNGGSVNKENTPPCSRDVLQCLKCSHYEFKSLLCRCKAYFDIYLKENGGNNSIFTPKCAAGSCKGVLVITSYDNDTKW